MKEVDDVKVMLFTFFITNINTTRTDVYSLNQFSYVYDKFKWFCASNSRHLQTINLTNTVDQQGSMRSVLINYLRPSLTCDF